MWLQVLIKHFLKSYLLVAYIKWYGNWQSDAQAIIENFITNIGSTPWWAINHGYGGVGPLVYKSSIVDSYSQGTQLDNPWSVVQNGFDNNLLPQDPNAIYIVLSTRSVCSFLIVLRGRGQKSVKKCKILFKWSLHNIYKRKDMA